MFLEDKVPRNANTNPPSLPHPPSLPPSLLPRIALVSVASSKMYACKERPKFPRAILPGIEVEVEEGREEGEEGGREGGREGSK